MEYYILYEKGYNKISNEFIRVYINATQNVLIYLSLFLINDTIATLAWSTGNEIK